MKDLPKSTLTIIRVGILVLLLVPLIYTVNQRWMSVRAALATANWELILAGIFILMLAQLLMGLISWIVLRDLNQRFSYLRILLMTPLQLLDFQKSQIIISHFDGVFRCFHEQITVIRCLFANFLPLSPNENGALTFLQ